MTEILHVTPRAGWDIAGVEGEYRGDSLAADGFLHCCLPGQLAGVVARYFRGQTGLVVLRNDSDNLKPPLKWE